ncbi:MAG: PEGA domain-containing protein [Candidatus Latescibacterota bacterium]
MRWSVFFGVFWVVLGIWMTEEGSASEGEILFFAEGAGGSGIYAMDFGGGHLRKVGAFSDQELVVTSMSVSRDGEKLLCVLAREEPGAARSVVMKTALPRSGMERYGEDREIGGAEGLQTAVLSPDGGRIAWVGRSADGGMDLWVKDVNATLEGSTHLVHCEVGAQIWSPSFDARSAWIFYAVNRGGNGRLGRVNPGGTVDLLHTMDGERIVSVDGSLDGEIAFMSARGKVLALRSDGSAVRTLGAPTKSESVQPRGVRWSQDGKMCVIGYFPQGMAMITDGGRVEKWTGDGSISRVYGIVAVRPVPEKKDLVSEIRRRATPELVLDSVPSGARITLDGKVMGDTPFRIHLEAGDHRILLEKAFCAPWEQSVYFYNGEKKRILATLEKRGNLRIFSEPPGARLSLDGVFAGLTPVLLESLPAEPRVLEVAYEGREPMRELVSVVPGRTIEVQVVLRKPLLPLLSAKDMVAPASPDPTGPDDVIMWEGTLRKGRSPWGMVYGGLSVGILGAKLVHEKADGMGISMCVGGLLSALVAFPIEKEDDKSQRFRAVREQHEKALQAQERKARLLEAQNAAIEAENREIEAFNRERAGVRVEGR